MLFPKKELFNLCSKQVLENLKSKMLRIIARFFPYILILAIGIFLWESFQNRLGNLFGVSKVETTHNIVLQNIKTLGKLELTSYTFKDIVEQKLDIDMFPDPKALLIVYGEAKGCVDLSLVSEKDIMVEDTTITIILPAPELCQYSIDHAKSKIYDAQYAFMNEALLFEEAFKSAQIKLKETALNSGILETTKENASIILKPLLQKVTGKSIIIQFKSE